MMVSFAMPAEDKVILSGDSFMIAINLRLPSESVINFNAEISELENIFTFSASKLFCLQQRHKGYS